MAKVTKEQAVQYFRRIGYQGPLAVTANTLRGLHRCHMLSVPYENLSVYYKEEIQLNWEWLFDKVVTQRRGGFCFELNYLFSHLLSYLGFPHSKHASRVWNRKTGLLGPAFDHLFLLVHLGGESWIVDVGLGDSFIQPLRLVQDVEQEMDSGIYRIKTDGEKYFLDVKSRAIVGSATKSSTGKIELDPGWERRFEFHLTPRTIADFYESCVYHQTSPEAPLTQGRLCTLARSWGRVTLAGEHLITTTYLGRNAVKKERKELDGEDEVTRVLEKEFGIMNTRPAQSVPERAASWNPTPIRRCSLDERYQVQSAMVLCLSARH